MRARTSWPFVPGSLNYDFGLLAFLFACDHAINSIPWYLSAHMLGIVVHCTNFLVALLVNLIGAAERYGRKLRGREGRYGRGEQPEEGPRSKSKNRSISVAE
jgi:hypothetical protein